LDNFLRINSLLFDFFIGISRIFIFKKKKFVWQLTRIIEQKLRIDKNKEGPIFYRYDRYYRDIQYLLNYINSSDFSNEIIGLFYELVAVNEIDALEVRLSLLWNYLEHFIFLYASNVKKNLLINQDQFLILKEKIQIIINNSLTSAVKIPINLDTLNSELRRLLNLTKASNSIPLEETEWRALKNSICSEIIDLINNNDILLPEYTSEMICNLIIQNITNFPPIRELIKLILQDISFNLSAYDKRTIEIMYIARNYLYHRSIHLDGLYSEIVKEIDGIESYNFESLKEEAQRFHKLLKKITDKALNTRFFEKIRPTSDRINYWFEPTFHGSITEFFINKLKFVQSVFSSEKKYQNLVSFVLRMTEEYDTRFNVIRSIEGIIYETRTNQYLLSQLEFKNKFHAKIRVRGGIAYPILYPFFIRLKNISKDYPGLLTFKTIIYTSFRSNTHDVYITVLDYRIELDETINLILWLAQRHISY